MYPPPPSDWQRPTLRDQLGSDHPELRALIRCACRRLCLPREMVDVRALPPDVRLARCREMPAPVPDFLCAPCLEAIHAQELIDRVAVAELQGAPVELCAWMAAKLERHPSITGQPQALNPEVEAVIEPVRAAFAAADLAQTEALAAETPPIV